MLLKFARVLMTVRRMRPGLAMVDALAAVIEDAHAVERLAHSHAWSTTRLSLAAFFERAISTLADERRLRAVAEQGLAHARGLLARQESDAGAAAKQRDALDAEARKLRVEIASLTLNRDAAWECAKTYRDETAAAQKDVEFYVREAKTFADQRDGAHARKKELEALIAEAGFQLECSAVGPDMPRREAGLLAQIKAETDYQIALLERIDRLSSAIRCLTTLSPTPGLDDLDLQPGDLEDDHHLPRKTHDAT